MAKSPKEYLFDTYMQEYGKHRDEIQNRINLQNGMAQRGVNITVLAATLLATLFTFFMKDYGKAPGSAASQNNVHLFVAVCLPVLFVHAALIQLTLATWIYQLSMIFRILRYWNWIVVKKIDPIIGRPGDAFLWDLLHDPPWDLDLDKRLIKYFQPLFLYVLCAFSLLGFPIALLWDCPGRSFSIVRWFGLIAFPVVGLTLFALAIVHQNLVSTTEGSKINVESENTQQKQNKDGMKAQQGG